MLKVALVGVGGISGAHIPAWLSMSDAKLVALCDIRPERTEAYPEINSYVDFDEMLNNEEIDILDICLPTYLHADFAEKAMNRGINVLCEKPVSLNKSDVKRLYDAAERNNVKFMVAQVLRFWREYEYIKKLYDEKIYGKLLSGSMNRLGCYPGWSWDGWMMDEKRSGLVPFDLHIHDLDFLVYAFGEPKTVTRFRSKQPNQDFCNNIYGFGDFFVTTQASWYASPYPFKASFIFQFENAVVAYENDKLTIYEKEGKVFSLRDAEANDVGEIGLPTSDAYANEICYFAHCVKRGVEPEKVKPCQLETVIDILKSL